MDLAVGVEMTLQLAGQEAIEASFAEIEPEHLLESILRISELSEDEVVRLAPDDNSRKELSCELATLNAEIARRSIHGTSLRRAVRKELGNGGCKYTGGAMHRSPAAQRVFNQARELSHRAGTVGVCELLKALLASPTLPIIRAMKSASSPDAASPACDLLKRYGTDLTRLAAVGKLPSTNDRNAECKVLQEALGRSKRRVVFLVTGSDKAARTVIATLAHTIIGADCPPTLNAWRIVEVSARHIRSAMRELLAECASFPNLILFLPSTAGLAEHDDRGSKTGALKSAVGKGCFQCVCRIGENEYEQELELVPEWRSLSEAIWIRDRREQGVPDVL